MPVLSVSLFKEMGRELGADTAALSASGILVECRQAPQFKPGCTSSGVSRAEPAGAETHVRLWEWCLGPRLRLSHSQHL